MEKYDVVIVGAGPGGLAAAKVLAENDKEVLVLEKNKIIGDKVCAGLLNLKKLGIKIPNSLLERKFRYFMIKTPLQNVKVDLEGKYLGTIDRKVLGDYMENIAIKSGARIWKETKVNKITNNSVILEDNRTIEFNYLIGADGSSSIVRNYLNLKNEKLINAFQYQFKGKIKDLEFYFDPKKFGPYYLWVFPYKNSFSVGSGCDLSKNKMVDIKEVKYNLDLYCKEKGLNLKDAEFEAAVINYDYKGHEFNNFYLVGDAGGFTPSLICDGINPAILSGIDVAKKILNKKYKFDNIKKILIIKRIEEKVLRSLEFSKKLTEIEVESLVMLFRSKLIDKFLLNNAE